MGKVVQMAKASKSRMKLGSLSKIRMKIPGGARITKYFKRTSKRKR
jgi:hypothetical protein